MSEDRESFVFHKDWYYAIKKRSPQLRVEIYDAIMQKVFEGTQKELSEVASVVMDLISPQIDRDTAKWLDIKAKRRESGKQGGLAKQANATKCYQMLPNDSKSKQNVANLPVSVSVSDSVSVENDNVLLEEKKDTDVSVKKESKRFVKPTIEEIRAYIFEKGYTFDAEAFFAFYESNGWKVGRNPMKNWKMACTTWAKNRNNNNNSYGRAKTNTEKFYESIAEANEFSQKLREHIGEPTFIRDGDTDEVW
jgi:hypothetical protein